jgi:peptide/nickel transport system ATP-binding protein
MYIGVMVEKSPAKELFKQPLHPYTKGLLSAIPIPNIDIPKKRVQLQGELTSPIEPRPRCRFVARCQYATEIATRTPIIERSAGHFVYCIM